MICTYSIMNRLMKLLGKKGRMKMNRKNKVVILYFETGALKVNDPDTVQDIGEEITTARRQS